MTLRLHPEQPNGRAIWGADVAPKVTDGYCWPSGERRERGEGLKLPGRFGSLSTVSLDMQQEIQKGGNGLSLRLALCVREGVGHCLEGGKPK